MRVSLVSELHGYTKKSLWLSEERGNYEGSQLSYFTLIWPAVCHNWCSCNGTESTLKELKEPYFTLEPSLKPTNLIQVSHLLLRSLSSKQSFWLVVTFLEEKACFRIDTSLWFDVYLQVYLILLKQLALRVNILQTTRLNVNISLENEAPFNF